MTERARVCVCVCACVARLRLEPTPKGIHVMQLSFYPAAL